MPSVGDILKDRGANYGTFLDNACIAQDLKKVIHTAITNCNCQMAPDQREALDLICIKIGRMISGSPNYVDNWDDIAGYASLISKRLRGEAI